MPDNFIVGVLQPIKVQMATGKMETAIMHLFEMQATNLPQPATPDDCTAAAAFVDAAAAPAAAGDVAEVPTNSTTTSPGDRRICALHERSPIQMFMFDKRGTLLTANKAARKGLQRLQGQHQAMHFVSLSHVHTVF